MMYIDMELQRVTKTGRETQRRKEGRRKAIILYEGRKQGRNEAIVCQVSIACIGYRLGLQGKQT
jgi:hypothetical protein